MNKKLLRTFLFVIGSLGLWTIGLPTQAFATQHYCNCSSDLGKAKCDIGCMNYIALGSSVLDQDLCAASCTLLGYNIGWVGDSCPMDCRMSDRQNRLHGKGHLMKKR